MKTENISLSTSEKISLISNFNTILSAGIPILETVDALLDGSKGNQKKVLETLKSDLTQGQHVYLSFSRFPKVFDKVTVHILKASEEAGTLEETLKDLKEDIKKDAEFSDKVRSALIYPLFIMVVFAGVMLLMLTFVIPRIATVFLSLKVTLPLPTKVLIFTSNTILTYKLHAAILAVVVFTIAIWFYKTKKRLFLQMISSLPVISNLVVQIDITKFSRSFQLLLHAGIPITSALELAEGVATRKDMQRMIAHSKEVVMAGGKLSDGLKSAKNIIPNIMIKIVEAGERTGSLDKSMREITEYFDYQVTTSLKAITSLIEPVMLVLVGILIGGMMLAIIAPMYSLISQVATR